MKFDFIESLKDRGAITYPMGDCMALADDRFYYRVFGNLYVQAAIRKGFDRWANSVEFVFLVPRTAKVFDRVMSRIYQAPIDERS
jgi:hypothetical protein